MARLRDTSEGAAVRAGLRVDNAHREQVEDALTVEAPLHIQINGDPYTTTMRTPGADQFLIRGLLFTEAIVTQPGAEMAFRPIADPDSTFAGCIDVKLAPGLIHGEFASRRSQISSSSCGLCGTIEPHDIELFGPPIALSECDRISAAAIHAMMTRMREGQTIFETTGGCHAAAIHAADGGPLALHEDIGRHNAVDKAIGELLTSNTLQRGAVLTVSGRMSYEIVFKAYRAGIPILCAVSAPSSMAVDTCAQFGMTLIGYCRDGRMTVYSHPERIR